MEIMKKASNERKTSRASREEGKQGALFDWRKPEEHKGVARSTPTHHVTKGIPFTIKL